MYEEQRQPVDEYSVPDYVADDERDELLDANSVEAICAQLAAPASTTKQAKEKKRLRDSGGGGGGDGDPVLRSEYEIASTAFNDLVRVTRPKFEEGHLNEVMFWSQGIIGMTPLEAIEQDRPEELRQLLVLDPGRVNAANVGEAHLTLLQSATHLGRFECIDVLIAAGAQGAIDILTITQSNLRLKLLPHLLPGCRRADLRAMELAHIAQNAAPVGRLLLRNVVNQGFAEGPGAPSVRWGVDKGTTDYRAVLDMWIDRVGADDFRDCKGKSLQEDAASMGNWTFAYRLQLRAVYTLLCVWTFTFDVNPAFCRIPKDVIRRLLIPLVYRPIYCTYCNAGVEKQRYCGGCRTIPVPCETCLQTRILQNSKLHQFPRCEKCEKHVCEDCLIDCVARPVFEDCAAVFCTRCAPATCNECIQYQIRMNDPESSSSSDGSDYDYNRYQAAEDEAEGNIVDMEEDDDDEDDEVQLYDRLFERNDPKPLPTPSAVPPATFLQCFLLFPGDNNETFI